MSHQIDMRTIEREGFTVTVWKIHDHDTNPNDFDCYNSEDIKAYNDDEWCYVGVVARAYLNGIELGESTLWGCEDGYMPGVRVDAFDNTLGEHDNDYDVPGEAINAAKTALKALGGKVPA